MELGHLLTRSGLTYPEVSSKVCHDSLCQSGNSFFITLGNLLRGILFTCCIHFLLYSSNLSKFVLFLIPLQFMYLFCKLLLLLLVVVVVVVVQLCMKVANLVSRSITLV